MPLQMSAAQMKMGQSGLVRSVQAGRGLKDKLQTLGLRPVRTKLSSMAPSACGA